MLAASVQLTAQRVSSGKHASMAFRLLPEPATALILFLVLAAVMPQMGEAVEVALTVAPIYIAYADCSAQRMAETGLESPVTVAIIFTLGTIRGEMP